MAKLLTPQEIADKQIKAATARVGDYRDGVLKTTKNPMQAAIAKKDKMVSNFNAAMDDGSWEDGLNAVSVEEWKQRTASKGGDNYARGVAASRDKIVDFQTQFTPVRRQVAAEVASMPDNTFEERLERMRANAMGLHQFRFRKRRRS
jgi:hypothetical protein